MIKLSVILITKNEAHNIEACLRSIDFADEIIIVDSGSTDKTITLAKQFSTAVIETADWPGFGPQKNRALAQAKGEWILSIDADERVTPELKAEILNVIQQKTEYQAFYLPRLSSFCGYFIKRCGWYPDYIVRLFRKDSGQFSNDLVHEKVIIDHGEIGKLKNHLIHHTYLTDEDVLRKLNHYSSLGAEQAFKSGKKSSLTKALLHAFSAFIKSYIVKMGFLEGSAGFMVSVSAAETVYHKYLKIWLIQKNNRV